MSGSEILKNATIEKIFACSIFPLTFLGVIGGAIGAMDRGFNPILVLGVGTVVAAVIVALLERVVPHCEDWRRSRSDIHGDAGHLVVSGILVPELTRPLASMAAMALAGWLSIHVGADLWPHEWPLAAQLALGLVIGEFPMSWAHRLAHEFDFLWRFHATHHSAARLYWLNAARFHPVDLLLSTVPWYIVLIGLGANLKIVALYTLVSGVHGVFQHANLKLRLGPMNLIFSMAELHRCHPSKTAA